MGRLIDVDVAEKILRDYADDVGCNRGEYELANGILKAVGQLRHNVPTAYDVEKVAKELEEMKQNFVSNAQILSARQIEKAIEIVRKGGVE